MLRPGLGEQIMAYPTPILIEALRTTAAKLEVETTVYRWTHMGACNCGHLAQHLTKKSAAELRRLSQGKAGEWADQAMEHCPTSNVPMDHVISKLLETGLEPEDIGHLERLSDKRVIRRLPVAERHMDFRNRGDVVRYLRAWANLLEEQLDLQAAELPRVA